MSSLNKAQVIGNMTRDPEIRTTTTNGNLVATFSVATSRYWKDSAGIKQEDTEFHNIVAWGKLAEICEKYTQKGKKIFVEGYLKTRSWEDDAGGKHYKTEIVAESIILLGAKQDTDEKESSIEQDFPEKKADEAKQTEKPKRTIPKEEEITIEDLPF